MNTLSNREIAELYKDICEQYRRRLCGQWELSLDASWWIPSWTVGGTLALNDCEISLGMEDVRLFVDNNIDYDRFAEWWDYVVECYCGHDTPISAYSWFVNNLRPDDLNKKEKYESNI